MIDKFRIVVASFSRSFRAGSVSTGCASYWITSGRFFLKHQENAREEIGVTKGKEIHLLGDIRGILCEKKRICLVGREGGVYRLFGRQEGISHRRRRDNQLVDHIGGLHPRRGSGVLQRLRYRSCRIREHRRWSSIPAYQRRPCLPYN